MNWRLILNEFTIEFFLSISYVGKSVLASRELGVRLKALTPAVLDIAPNSRVKSRDMSLMEASGIDA